MPDLQPSHEIERTVQAALDVPEPATRFLSDLGDRLEARARTIAESRPGPGPGFRLLRRPLWQLALALALVVSLAVLGIGPQRVLAQVQRLLGYLPGFGFIELNGPMILSGPVTAQHGDVAVQVSQALATSEATLVQFSITLPGGAAAETLAADPDLEFAPRLLLDDQTALDSSGRLLGLSDGRIDFPALPKGSRQATLVFNCLPNVLKGCVPGEWRFALQFVPATQEQFAGFLSQPYDPQVEATVNGITMRVQQVAHTGDETAIQFETEWANSTWSWSTAGDPNDAKLSDDYGHPYEIKTVGPGGMTSLPFIQVTMVPPRSPQDTPTGQMVTQVETAHFGPVSSAARRLNFSVDWVHLEVPAQGEFSLDLGPDPYVGETWTLDQTLTVAGFNVRLIGARLQQAMEPNPTSSGRRGSSDSPGQVPYYWIEFLFEAAQPPDRWLESFEAEPVSGSQSNATNRESEAAGGGSGPIRWGFATMDLPHGLQVYRIDWADVALRGPWQFGWSIPGASLLRASKRQAHPPDAAQEQNGLLLKLGTVQASDQWSDVQLTAPSLAAGERLLYALSWNPLTQSEPARPDLYLLADHGRRYDVTGGVQPPFSSERYDPATVEFGPLPADANHVSLHVPAAEIQIPAQAVFTATVPSEVWFPEQALTTPNTRAASAAWPLDLRLDVAGYAIHFNQAYLQREYLDHPGGAIQLVLSGTPLVESRAGRELRTLRVSSIRRPDGRTWVVEDVPQSPGLELPPVLEVAPTGLGTADLAATLRLDVTAANGFDLLPGDYEIGLDSATVIAAGPWDLGFSLPGK